MFLGTNFCKNRNFTSGRKSMKRVRNTCYDQVSLMKCDVSSIVYLKLIVYI